MSALLLLASVVASGGAVLLPEGNFPALGRDYHGGPMDGVMGQLRDEKQRLPVAKDVRALEAVLAIGEGRSKGDVSGYVLGDAKHIIAPYGTAPERSASLSKAGFLKAYEGCQRTKPMLLQMSQGESLIRVFWSCGGVGPRYLMQDLISLKDGKIARWQSDMFFLANLAPEWVH